MGKRRPDYWAVLSVKDGCRESWCSNDWPTLEIYPEIIFHVISPLSSHLEFSRIDAALELCCWDSAKICRDLYPSLKVKLYFIPWHQRWVTWEKVKRKRAGLLQAHALPKNFPQSISFLSSTRSWLTGSLFWLLIILFDTGGMNLLYLSTVWLTVIQSDQTWSLFQ